MLFRLPKVSAGDRQIPSVWFSEVEKWLRAITPNAGSGISVLTTSGGTSFSVPQTSQSNQADIHFYAQVTGTKVSIRGGFVQLIYNGSIYAVEDLIMDNPEDGDKIWVEFSSADDVWSIADGADYPTDKIFLPLVENITVDDGNVTIADSDYAWSGGDLLVSEVFMVTLTMDGGNPGGSDNNCTYTYTATTGGGVVISTDMEPDNGRTANTAYTAATFGLVCIKTDGSFGLVATDETPVAAATMFPVTLTQVGGDDATRGVPFASWTYDVADLNGNALASGAAPLKPRPAGSMTAAAAGVGYVNASGTFTLVEAYETPNVREHYIAAANDTISNSPVDWTSPNLTTNSITTVVPYLGIDDTPTTILTAQECTPPDPPEE